MIKWKLKIGRSFRSLSEQVILLMSLDGHIGGWVGDAGQDEAISHLVLVEE